MFASGASATPPAWVIVFATWCVATELLETGARGACAGLMEFIITKQYLLVNTKR